MDTENLSKIWVSEVNQNKNKKASRNFLEAFCFVYSNQ